MRLVEGESAIYTFRGRQFQLAHEAWECPDTGERYTAPEQDAAFIAHLHTTWREKRGISAVALRKRRTQLGLSAAQTSALLGLGVNQYREYESTDKLPSKSNAQLLRLLCDDRSLVSLMEAADIEFTPASKRKLQTYLARPVEQLIIPRLSNRRFVELTNTGGSFDIAPTKLPANLRTAFMRFNEANAVA